MNKTKTPQLLCTGRKRAADLVKDCNSCDRFRVSMIVVGYIKELSWVNSKPNSNESCVNYVKKTGKQ